MGLHILLDQLCGDRVRKNFDVKLSHTQVNSKNTSHNFFDLPISFNKSLSPHNHDMSFYPSPKTELISHYQAQPATASSNTTHVTNIRHYLQMLEPDHK